MTKEQIKGVLQEWSKDIWAGATFSAFVSWLKYFFQHFVDIIWTALAAIVVMLVTHYGRKYLIPWCDKKIEKWLK